jgi:hypothetical protein
MIGLGMRSSDEQRTKTIFCSFVMIPFVLLGHVFTCLLFLVSLYRLSFTLSLSFSAFSLSLSRSSFSSQKQALADALLADPELLARSVEELFESGTIAELLRLARALPDNLELQASIASILRCR